MGKSVFQVIAVGPRLTGSTCDHRGRAFHIHPPRILLVTWIGNERAALNANPVRMSIECPRQVDTVDHFSVPNHTQHFTRRIRCHSEDTPPAGATMVETKDQSQPFWCAAVDVGVNAEPPMIPENRRRAFDGWYSWLGMFGLGIPRLYLGL